MFTWHIQFLPVSWPEKNQEITWLQKTCQDCLRTGMAWLWRHFHLVLYEIRTHDKFFGKLDQTLDPSYFSTIFLRPNIFTRDCSTYLPFYFFCFTSFSNPEGKIFQMGFSNWNNWFLIWISGPWVQNNYVTVKFHINMYRQKS